MARRRDPLANQAKERAAATALRVESIYDRACAGLGVPATGVAIVLSTGVLWAADGHADDEVERVMVQAARDAAAALAVRLPNPFMPEVVS